MGAATRFSRKLMGGLLTGFIFGVLIGTIGGFCLGAMVPALADLANKIPFCQRMGDATAAGITEAIGNNLGDAVATMFAGMFAGAILGALWGAVKNLVYSDMVE